MALASALRRHSRKTSWPSSKVTVAPSGEPAREPGQAAVDSSQGRQLYSRRIVTDEPVFAHIRHHKRMSRFTLHGKTKLATQWQIYCLVHNIEKIATKAMRTG